MSDDVTAKLQKQLASYPLRAYGSGQTMLFANENPSTIYYLASGRVRMYDVSPKGNEVVVNIYEPGRFFPLGWALNHTPNHFFYKTETECQIRLVPTDEVLDIIINDPDITLDLLRRIYQKTQRMMERMVFLMSASAARRLMYELVVECRRFGAKQPDGSCLIAIREIDLASRAGLSRETVSREFQKLKERKLVRLEKQGIRIYDITKLEAEIGAIP